MLPAQQYSYLIYKDPIDSTSQKVAQFDNGKVIFMQPRLRKIMETNGIHIPPNERKDYGNIDIIWLKDNGDLFFEKAFRSIYYRLHMPKDEYIWLENYSN